MSNLFNQMRSDWKSHGKDWTKPGFRALAFYRFGVWRMTIRFILLRAPASILYRFLYRHARNVYGIELPYSAVIGDNVIFEHQHGIVIHGNAIIGNNCVIRQGVTIGNRFLDEPTLAPKLGDNVNVGAGAKLLGNIVIGDNCQIGANSVVLKSVLKDNTVVGIPAKIIA
jgi:serine O-acetyltransferase